jgi:uridine phosphorylase
VVFLIYSEKNEYHLSLREGDVGRYAILPGDPGRCEKIAAMLSDARLIAQNREFTTYTGYLSGEKVSVISTGIGGPSAAIAMEEAVHLGCDTFIRIGTAGGMAPKVKSGDLVIATAAIRSEGTSLQYAPPEFPAVGDFSVIGALSKSAELLGLSHHVGVVHSKDSFYAQHDPSSMPVGHELIEKWNAFIKCGALASEMETAALFTVASVRGVRCGSVLLVMGNQTRREEGLPEEIVYDTTSAVKVAVNALKMIIEQDKTKEANIL